MNETRARNMKLLDTHLGPLILKLLEDRTITDIMMNPDGTLWVDRHETGQEQVESGYSQEKREAIIAAVAGLLDTEATKARPIVQGELPFYKHRFHGVLPPVSEGPLFSIRTHHMQHLTIEDFARQGVITAQQEEVIRACIDREDNIIVSGKTGSGKSTFVNAFLLYVALLYAVRLLIVEDTRELQCTAKNHLTLRTNEYVTLRELVRTALRLRPDRLIIGEVRGPESLDLLGAWNTGHRGGFATLHANGVAHIFGRLQDLVAQSGEGVLTPTTFAGAVNVLIHMEKVGPVRRVTEIVRVNPTGQSFELTSLT